MANRKRTSAMRTTHVDVLVGHLDVLGSEDDHSPAQPTKPRPRHQRCVLCAHPPVMDTGVGHRCITWISFWGPTRLMMPQRGCPRNRQILGLNPERAVPGRPVGVNVMRVLAGAQSSGRGAPFGSRTGLRLLDLTPVVSTSRAPVQGQETGPAGVPATMKLVVQEAGPSGK